MMKIYFTIFRMKEIFLAMMLTLSAVSGFSQTQNFTLASDTVFWACPNSTVSIELGNGFSLSTWFKLDTMIGTNTFYVNLAGDTLFVPRTGDLTSSTDTNNIPSYYHFPNLYGVGFPDSSLTVKVHGIHGDTTFTFTVKFYPLPYGQPICLVSLDTVTGKNLVVWEKTHGERIETFKIYRTGVGINTAVFTIPFDSLSEYLDSASEPNITYQTYWMTTVDSCGVESPYSTQHVTIFLQQNGQNLVWTPYQGNPGFHGYFLYKSVMDTAGHFGAYQEIDSTLNTSYTDPNYSNHAKYLIVAPVGGCNPTRSINTVFSNILNTSVTGIESLSQSKVELYPNPSDGNFTIKGSLGKIKIFNALSQLVFNGTGTDKANFNLNLTSGIYFVQFGNSDEVRKLVIK